MARKTQYQPTKREGAELSDAQEVRYNKEFKQADIAGGYRKRQIERLNR
ncbi:YfhE family protein [Aquibacillus salsiterrae]|uniref:YfhE family protein n=1 Tax=Aquibacillus salsiterrae TaxID=2950439 RepID=A0A9X3WEM9_9BACI|nr:YfhE family protein [Aquibacillus salsiterrae]MDC3417051.1 YfhE family protein [Aquibacillus salsiterrae]